MALQETFYCGSEASRRKALQLIESAPLYDDQERQLVIIIKRAVSGYGRSKKRLFHALVNVIADYRDLPPAALKQAFKARFCPLEEFADPISGEITWTPKGISQLDDDEIAKVCESVVQFCGDEWHLPLPATDQEWSVVKYGGLAALIASKEIA